MRIGQINQGRPPFYDRNPVSRGTSFATTVGPHGNTNRWTYTVPTGKKANINNVLNYTTRQTAAAPVGSYGAEVDATFLDATAAQLAITYNNDNVVGSPHSSNVGQTAPMMAGEQLLCNSSDASTGGTWVLIVTAWLTEFDV